MLATLPVIEEFRQIVWACPLPDPNRWILSFRVSNNVVCVQVFATMSGGTAERLIYDRSAETGRPWSSFSDSVQDPGAAWTWDTYVLVVTGAHGQALRKHLNLYYRIPVTFDLRSPAVTKTRLGAEMYGYTFNYRAENVARFWVTVKFGYGRTEYPGASPVFALSFGGSEQPHWDIRTNLNHTGPAEFIFHVQGERNVCGGGEIFERTAVLPQEAYE